MGLRYKSKNCEGLIKRHFEYVVKSDRYRSEVNRRYSDFQILYDLLLQRFPYRLIPKLPPAKLLAIVSGSESDVIDSRRKALTRWIQVITSHPVITNDPMIKFFLTDLSVDFYNFLKDQFRHLPDEYILSPHGPTARNMATPGLRANVMAHRAKLMQMKDVLNQLSILFEKMKNQYKESNADLNLIAKEFATLSTSDISGSSEWSMVKDRMYKASKQSAEIGSVYSQLATQSDENVLQKILLLLDIITAFEDLCFRQDKGITNDQKRGLDKILMIKRRDTRGILTTNSDWREQKEIYILDFRGILTTNSGWREQIEKQIGEHEVILSDLECRQAFSLVCADSEIKLCLNYFNTINGVLESLSQTNSKFMNVLANEWTKLSQ